MNDFEQFYQHYPRKKGRLAAEKKFNTLKKSKQLPDIDALIKSIHDQIKEKKYLRSQNQFCPEWKYPATWLNQGCWTDVCILPPTRKPKTRAVTGFDTLQRAHNVLCNLGEDKFNSFCNQMRISDYDKECVLMAANGGPRNVKKLASGMLQGVG